MQFREVERNRDTVTLFLPISPYFSFVGGLLTSTMNFNFESGEAIKAVAVFGGLDQDGYIRVTLTLDGTIPEVEEGSQLLVADHKDVYTRRQNGKIKDLYLVHHYGLGSLMNGFIHA